MIPNMSLFCCEDYISNDNKLCIKSNTASFILSNTSAALFNCYIFIVVDRNKLSDRVFDYYKVWKRYDSDIRLLKTGYEQRYSVLDNEIYISVALFDILQIDNIMDFLFEHSNNAFVYISKRNDLLQKEKSEHIYYSICNRENSTGFDKRFYLRQFYDSMTEGELVLSVSSDGEIIGCDVLCKR